MEEQEPPEGGVTSPPHHGDRPSEYIPMEGRSRSWQPVIPMGRPPMAPAPVIMLPGPRPCIASDICCICARATVAAASRTTKETSLRMRTPRGMTILSDRRRQLLQDVGRRGETADLVRLLADLLDALDERRLAYLVEDAGRHHVGLARVAERRRAVGPVVRRRQVRELRLEHLELLVPAPG